MRLIERMHHKCKGRCDICQKKINLESSVLMTLCDSSSPIRKNSNNCFLACAAAVEYLDEYHIRDQILIILGRYGDFVCPKKRAGKPQKRIKDQSDFEVGEMIDDGLASLSKSVAGSVSNNSLNDILRRVEVPVTRHYLGLKRFDVIDENSESVSAHEISTDDINQRILEALRINALPSHKISLYLDKAKELNLSSYVIDKLKLAIADKVNNYNARSSYTVDDEGAVHFEKLRSKETLSVNEYIGKSGRYQCLNCHRHAYYLFDEMAKCVYCRGKLIQQI